MAKKRRKTRGFSRTFVISLVLLSISAVAVVAKPPGQSSSSQSDSLCPKLGQASLNLDTAGCQTALTSAVSEARTSWKIEKTAATSTPLYNPSNEPVLFNVKVTEGSTKNTLVIGADLIVSNSGEQTPVLTSAVMNLQNSPAHQNVSTAVAVKDPACRDGQNVEGGQTCFGQYQNSPGAALTLTDTNGNDVTAYLGTVPIPPSTDCSGAVTLRLKAEFDLAQAGLSPGSPARIEVLTTFAGAGARGKSPETVSCTADVNCSGGLDGDDPSTCQLNESEQNNIRTVKQRASIVLPPLTPVCASVNKTDAGAAAVDGSCVDVSSNSLSKIIAKHGEGSTDAEQVSGTVSCKNKACSTDVTNTANLYCLDGRNEFIQGSPAGASVPVVCEKKGDEISVGGFCTATQGCWGQPKKGFCSEVRNNQFASLLAAFGANFGIASPDGIRIGDLNGPAGASGGYAAKWTSGAAVDAFLSQGTPAGTLTGDLSNPSVTSSGVLGAQLLAATLNKARDDAGLFSKNATEKLANLVLQSCADYSVAPSLQGLTVKQLICVADKAVGGTVGCSGANIPSCEIAVTPPDCGLTAPVSSSLADLVAALDAVNNNFDACGVNHGCLRLP